MGGARETTHQDRREFHDRRDRAGPGIRGEAAPGPSGGAWLLAALVVVALLLRLHLLFVHEVNWDEFLPLAKV